MVEGENFLEQRKEAKQQGLLQQAEELQEKLVRRELQNEMPTARGAELLMRAVIALLKGKDGSDEYVREKLGRALNELDVAVPSSYQEAIEPRAQTRQGETIPVIRQEGGEREKISVEELYERIDQLEQRLTSLEIKMNN